MLLSNKIKLLSLFSAFVICANFANATETVTFHFYYESGINDVDYVYNNFYDGSNMHTPQISKSDGQTSVSVTAKMDDKTSIANSFISNLTPAPNIHMVGLNTTDSQPDELDFWIAGTLSINGETVSHEFYIARIPDHYWLGTLDGQTYIGSNVFNPQTNRGMQVYSSTTKQPYCLLEHGTEYYAVYVYPGTCDNALNHETDTQELALQWGEGVSSISFEPFESSGFESGQITSVKTTSTTIRITAAPLNSGSVAASFNQLIPENGSCSGTGYAQNVYEFELYVQGLVCGPHPQYLDFYLSGYMKINGYYVAYNDKEKNKDPDNYINRVFVLAYGGGRWWLATPEFPFSNYGGGGVTYNNHADLNTTDGGWYRLKAISENGFKVSSY